MTSKQREYYYACNLNDFEKQFRTFNSDNPKESIDKSIAYLLKFGLSNPKEPMKRYRRILFEVRKQVALQVARKQYANDPKNLTNMHSKDDLEVQHFLAHPVDYVVNKLKDEEYYNSIKPQKLEGVTDKEYEKFSQAYDKNKDRLVKVMDTSTFKVRYNGNENSKLIAKDILDLLHEKMPNSSIPAELAKGKYSFWERRLFWRSREFKAFKKTIIAFNLRQSPNSRDSKALEDSAMAYLRHKFPNLKEGELPTLEQIATLGAKGKVRATLCLNVVKSCQEVKQADKLVTAVRNLNLNPNDLIKNKPEPENVAQMDMAKENKEEYIIKKATGLKSAFRNKDKPKKSVKFDAPKKSPKRYMNKEGRVVGGTKDVKAIPPQLRKERVKWEKNLATEEEAILEEEQLKKDIEAEQVSKKVVAPDNNDFLKELKDEVEDKSVEISNNNNISANDLSVEENKSELQSLEIEN